MTTLAPGDRAPNFLLTATNGERYSLDDKLTLAIFFKTSCPTCQYAWPFYQRLYQAYKKAGLEVWGISQHDREKTRQYAVKYEATFPHLVDEDWRVSREYDPEFVPTGFLIGGDKKILEVLVSWNRADLDRLSRVIASRLRVTSQEMIKPDENVVVFKPG
jgi:peroxiredoxin